MKRSLSMNDKLYSLYSSVLLVITVVLTIVLGGFSTTLACDACANNECTPGFQQGTYGCTSGEAECSWAGRLLGICEGKFCSTAGNPPCDNLSDKPLEPELEAAKPEDRIGGTCPLGVEQDDAGAPVEDI